jgi:beta-glucosidase
VLDVIFGQFNPGGKLPFEIPCSMEAVHAQKEDVPYDLENPLFPFGYGLSYMANEEA